MSPYRVLACPEVAPPRRLLNLSVWTFVWSLSALALTLIATMWIQAQIREGVPLLYSSLLMHLGTWSSLGYQRWFDPHRAEKLRALDAPFFERLLMTSNPDTTPETLKPECDALLAHGHRNFLLPRQITAEMTDDLVDRYGEEGWEVTRSVTNTSTILYFSVAPPEAEKKRKR